MARADRQDVEEMHDPNLSQVTRFGFIWKGVHFERCCDDGKGGIVVYISTKKQNGYIRVTKGGRIKLEID